MNRERFSMKWINWVGLAVLTVSPLATASYEFRQVVSGLKAPAGLQVPESCKSILDSGQSAGDGLYEISPNGGSPIQVYCDMTTDGGGWTLVVAQFETDPVENWNEGIAPDYDPSLQSQSGFALSSSQMPTHNQTAFSRGLSAGEFEWFNLNYTTGDIGLTEVVGQATGHAYFVYRNESNYYWDHDVGEKALEPDAEGSRWGGTLAVDRKGGWLQNWAFSPSIGPDRSVADIGFAFQGARRATLESYAWTVWVR